MRNAIRSLNENEFQRFCGVLLSAEYPTFQAVNGAGGDMGNDGFLASGGTLFQAYGPALPTAQKTRDKINDSFAKFAVLRSGVFPNLQRLVLLTPFDLTHEAHVQLQTAASRSVAHAESWGETKLTSLLAAHPTVKSAFPDLVLPDVAQGLAELREAVENLAPMDLIEELAGPDHEPDLYVLQRNEHAGQLDRRAYEFSRIRIYAERFARQPFEPDEEARFLDAVREIFVEDRGAQLEAPSSTGVLVEHREADLRFHRRWGWWTTGAVGMAATLPDLHRPNTYSAADIATDLVRALQFATRLGGEGPARILFDLAPFKHRVTWDPSNVRARHRLDARLEGIDSVARPQLEQPKVTRVESKIELSSIDGTVAALVGDILIAAMRDLHGTRIRKSLFVDSIGRVLAADICARGL